MFLLRSAILSVLLSCACACVMDSGVQQRMPVRDPGSSARRRRRLCAQWRHEQQTVAMALAVATHHSAQRGEWRDPNEALRGQKTATAGQQGVFKERDLQGEVKSPWIRSAAARRRRRCRVHQVLESQHVRVQQEGRPCQAVGTVS